MRLSRWGGNREAAGGSGDLDVCEWDVRFNINVVPYILTGGGPRAWTLKLLQTTQLEAAAMFRSLTTLRCRLRTAATGLS